jgi:hypothetical protein
MPVFSRRLCKKFLFLGMNLAVQVAAARAGLLQPRPGAAPEIALEQESVRGQRAARQRTTAVPAERRPPRCDLRRLAGERLRTAGTAVGLARLQLRIGNTEDVAATLDRLQEEIQSLRRQLERGREPAAPRPRKPQLNGDDRGERELLAGCPG